MAGRDSERLDACGGDIRADAGEYRIVYDLAERSLRVMLIGKRNDAEVYRRLR